MFGVGGDRNVWGSQYRVELVNYIELYRQTQSLHLLIGCFFDVFEPLYRATESPRFQQPPVLSFFPNDVFELLREGGLRGIAYSMNLQGNSAYRSMNTFQIIIVGIDVE